MTRYSLSSIPDGRRILQSLLLDGPASKAELARRLGDNQVKIGRAVSELLERGMVSGGDLASEGRGRPGRKIHLSSSSSLVIGFKVRDQKIIGVLTNLQASVLAQIEHTLTANQPSKVVDEIFKSSIQLAAAGGTGLEEVLAIGLGFSGLIDPARGILEDSPFLHWKNVKIRDELAARFSKPVYIENDVNTLALAELWFGSSSEAQDSLILTIGQGIGLSVVKGGRVLNIPAEFGHTKVSDNNRVCNCGNVGCIEALAGESAILEAVNALSVPKVTSVLEVYALAESELAIREILSEAASEIGQGLSNLINLFKPSTVFISGEGLLAGASFTEDIIRAANLRCHPFLRGSFSVLIDDLTDAAWARGAASLALHEIFGSQAFEDFKKIAP